ncbi:MAG: VanZ family protein, partial [Planctomycetota bacterium]
ALEHPTSFWHVPEQTRLLWRFDSSYAILFESLHVLLFAPFGVLLWLRKRRPGLGPVLRIVLLGLAVGTAFQIIKIGFPGRHPSLYHAPFNALGTLLGAYLAARLTRASARTTP